MVSVSLIFVLGTTYNDDSSRERNNIDPRQEMASGPNGSVVLLTVIILLSECHKNSLIS